MIDFIYEGKVRILYGAGKMDNVVEKIKSLGNKVLLVPTASFIRSGKLD